MVLNPFEEWLMKGILAGALVIIGYLISNFVLRRKTKLEDDGQVDKVQPLLDKMNEILTKINSLDVKIEVMSANNKHVEQRLDEFRERLNDHSRRINTLEKDHAKNH